MNVEQIMNRDVKTCSPFSSVEDAVRIMWDNDCGCVPVVDENRFVVGMLTDRDVCIAAWSRGCTLFQMIVSSVMSSHVHACNRLDSIESAEEKMKSQRIRRLPVLGADKRLVGILSLNDIAREWSASNRSISADSVAETLCQLSQPPERGELALEIVPGPAPVQPPKARASLVGSR